MWLVEYLVARGFLPANSLSANCVPDEDSFRCIAEAVGNAVHDAEQFGELCRYVADELENRNSRGSPSFYLQQFLVYLVPLLGLLAEHFSESPADFLVLRSAASASQQAYGGGAVSLTAAAHFEAVCVQVARSVSPPVAQSILLSALAFPKQSRFAQLQLLLHCANAVARHSLELVTYVPSAVDAVVHVCKELCRGEMQAFSPLASQLSCAVDPKFLQKQHLWHEQVPAKARLLLVAKGFANFLEALADQVDAAHVFDAHGIFSDTLYSGILGIIFQLRLAASRECDEEFEQRFALLLRCLLLHAIRNRRNADLSILVDPLATRPGSIEPCGNLDFCDHSSAYLFLVAARDEQQLAISFANCLELRVQLPANVLPAGACASECALLAQTAAPALFALDLSTTAGGELRARFSDLADTRLLSLLWSSDYVLLLKTVSLCNLLNYVLLKYAALFKADDLSPFYIAVLLEFSEPVLHALHLGKASAGFEHHARLVANLMRCAYVLRGDKSWPAIRVLLERVVELETNDENAVGLLAEVASDSLSKNILPSALLNFNAAQLGILQVAHLAALHQLVENRAAAGSSRDLGAVRELLANRFGALESHERLELEDTMRELRRVGAHEN